MNSEPEARVWSLPLLLAMLLFLFPARRLKAVFVCRGALLLGDSPTTRSDLRARISGRLMREQI